jgi:hypothetical protein
MRIILLLAFVARVFDDSIFQPTYLLEPKCGLREILIDQAKVESRKESAIRGSLHALLPNSQATAANRRVQQACREIKLVVDEILPRDLSLEFQNRLETIAESARDRWEVLLRSKSAIEPSFDVEVDENWPWHELRLEAGRTTVSVKSQESGEDTDQCLLVVFPRLYTCDQEGETPMSHGVVLLASQVAAAKREDAERQPMIKRTITRRAGNRRASNDGEGRSPVFTARSFLPQSPRS